MTFWLSYADNDGFLGVVLIKADGFLQAAMISAQSGCSPGGQVLGEELNEEFAAMIPGSYYDRLLERKEVFELGQYLLSRP